MRRWRARSSSSAALRMRRAALNSRRAAEPLFGASEIELDISLGRRVTTRPAVEQTQARPQRRRRVARPAEAEIDQAEGIEILGQKRVGAGEAGLVDKAGFLDRWEGFGKALLAQIGAGQRGEAARGGEVVLGGAGRGQG